MTRQPETPPHGCSQCAVLSWDDVGVAYGLAKMAETMLNLRLRLRWLRNSLVEPPPGLKEWQLLLDWVEYEVRARVAEVDAPLGVIEHYYVVARIFTRMLRRLEGLEDLAKAGGKPSTRQERLNRRYGSTPPPSREGRSLEHERMRQVWLRAQRWAHKHGAFDRD
jgi:hypothetical protein